MRTDAERIQLAELQKARRASNYRGRYHGSELSRAVRGPTVVDLATRAGYAAWRATAAVAHGERVLVAESEYAARSAACETCEFWDGKARLGLGKCNAPGCGCTKLKRWLATEKCPLGKWAD